MCVYFLYLPVIQLQKILQLNSLENVFYSHYNMLKIMQNTKILDKNQILCYFADLTPGSQLN